MLEPTRWKTLKARDEVLAKQLPQKPQEQQTTGDVPISMIPLADPGLKICFLKALGGDKLGDVSTFVQA